MIGGILHKADGSQLISNSKLSNKMEGPVMYTEKGEAVSQININTININRLNTTGSLNPLDLFKSLNPGVLPSQNIRPTTLQNQGKVVGRKLQNQIGVNLNSQQQQPSEFTLQVIYSKPTVKMGKKGNEGGQAASKPPLGEKRTQHSEKPPRSKRKTHSSFKKGEKMQKQRPASAVLHKNAHRKNSKSAAHISDHPQISTIKKEKERGKIFLSPERVNVNAYGNRDDINSSERKIPPELKKSVRKVGKHNMLRKLKKTQSTGDLNESTTEKQSLNPPHEQTQKLEQYLRLFNLKTLPLTEEMKDAINPKGFVQMEERLMEELSNQEKKRDMIPFSCNRYHGKYADIIRTQRQKLKDDLLKTKAEDLKKKDEDEQKKAKVKEENEKIRKLNQEKLEKLKRNTNKKPVLSNKEKEEQLKYEQKKKAQLKENEERSKLRQKRREEGRKAIGLDFLAPEFFSKFHEDAKIRKKSLSPCGRRESVKKGRKVGQSVDGRKMFGKKESKAGGESEPAFMNKEIKKLLSERQAESKAQLQEADEKKKLIKKKELKSLVKQQRLRNIAQKKEKEQKDKEDKDNKAKKLKEFETNVRKLVHSTEKKEEKQEKQSIKDKKSEKQHKKKKSKSKKAKEDKALKRMLKQTEKEIEMHSAVKEKKKRLLNVRSSPRLLNAQSPETAERELSAKPAWGGMKDDGIRREDNIEEVKGRIGEEIEDLERRKEHEEKKVKSKKKSKSMERLNVKEMRLLKSSSHSAMKSGPIQYQNFMTDSLPKQSLNKLRQRAQLYHKINQIKSAIPSPSINKNKIMTPQLSKYAPGEELARASENGERFNRSNRYGIWESNSYTVNQQIKEPKRERPTFAHPNIQAAPSQLSEEERIKTKEILKHKLTEFASKLEKHERAKELAKEKERELRRENIMSKFEEKGVEILDFSREEGKTEESIHTEIDEKPVRITLPADKQIKIPNPPGIVDLSKQFHFAKQKQLQQNNQAAIVIQKYARGFLGRALVNEVKKGLYEIEEQFDFYNIIDDHLEKAEKRIPDIKEEDQELPIQKLTLETILKEEEEDDDPFNIIDLYAKLNIDKFNRKPKEKAKVEIKEEIEKEIMDDYSVDFESESISKGTPFSQSLGKRELKPIIKKKEITERSMHEREKESISSIPEDIIANFSESKASLKPSKFDEQASKAKRTPGDKSKSYDRSMISSIKDYDSENEKELEPQSLIYSSNRLGKKDIIEKELKESERKLDSKREGNKEKVDVNMLTTELLEKDREILREKLKQIEVEKDYQQKLNKESEGRISEFIEMNKQMYDRYSEHLQEVANKFMNHLDQFSERNKQINKHNKKLEFQIKETSPLAVVSGVLPNDDYDYEDFESYEQSQSTVPISLPQTKEKTQQKSKFEEIKEEEKNESVLEELGEISEDLESIAAHKHLNSISIRVSTDLKGGNEDADSEIPSEYGDFEGEEISITDSDNKKPSSDLDKKIPPKPSESKPKYKKQKTPVFKQSKPEFPIKKPIPKEKPSSEKPIITEESIPSQYPVDDEDEINQTQNSTQNTSIELNKFKKLLKADKISKLIQMRERALKKQITDKQYKEKKAGLDRWEQKERKVLEDEKQILLEGWRKAAKLINQTERDIEKAKAITGQPIVISLSSSREDSQQSMESLSQWLVKQEDTIGKETKQQLERMKAQDETGRKERKIEILQKKTAAARIMKEKQKAIEEGIRERMLKLEESEADKLLKQALNVNIKEEIEKRAKLLKEIPKQPAEYAKPQPAKSSDPKSLLKPIAQLEVPKGKQSDKKVKTPEKSAKGDNDFLKSMEESIPEDMLEFSVKESLGNYQSSIGNKKPTVPEACSDYSADFESVSASASAFDTLKKRKQEIAGYSPRDDDYSETFEQYESQSHLNVKGLPTVEEKQKSKEDDTVRQQKISILDEENLTPVEEKSIDDIFDMNKKLLMSTEDLEVRGSVSDIEWVINIESPRKTLLTPEFDSKLKPVAESSKAQEDDEEEGDKKSKSKRKAEKARDVLTESSVSEQISEELEEEDEEIETPKGSIKGRSYEPDSPYTSGDMSLEDIDSKYSPERIKEMLEKQAAIQEQENEDDDEEVFPAHIKPQQEPEDKDNKTDQITDLILKDLLEEIKHKLKIKKHIDLIFLSPPQKKKHIFEFFDEQIPQITEITKNEDLAYKGIQTDLKAVRSYIDEVSKEIRININKFIQNLAIPLNRDPLFILGQIQSEDSDYFQEIETIVTQPVLPVELYLEIERNRKGLVDSTSIDKSHKNRIATNNSSSESRSEIELESFIGEWSNIHNKCIFDAINDALDYYRPFSINGPPLPWSKHNRTLTYTHKDSNSLNKILDAVKEKVVKWALTNAGVLKLPQEEGLPESNSSINLQNDSSLPLSDNEKLNQLREEKLAGLLAAEVNDNEHNWIDYELEETQTKLDIADMILEQLAGECVEILAKKRPDQENLLLE